MTYPAISPEAPLILGSASPRRRDILHTLGIPHRVCPADIDEAVQPGELPEIYLSRIASEKLQAVAALPVVTELSTLSPTLVLVADTSVVLGDAILGKPADVADAERLLTSLVGRSHRVMTRYALGGVERGRLEVLAARTETTQVSFRSCGPRAIRRYAESGEGADKAGAYAAQGLGAFLLRGIEGSYSNVIGLPACELVEDLERLGLLVSFP